MTIDGNEKIIALVKRLNKKSGLLCEPNGLEIWLERSTGEVVPLEECNPPGLGTADGDFASHIHLEGWIIPPNTIPGILEENDFRPWGTMLKGRKTLGHCYGEFLRLSYIYERLKRGIGNAWFCPSTIAY